MTYLGVKKKRRSDFRGKITKLLVMVCCSDLSLALSGKTGNNSIYHKHGGDVVLLSVDKCSAYAVVFEPGYKVQPTPR